MCDKGRRGEIGPTGPTGGIITPFAVVPLPLGDPASSLSQVVIQPIKGRCMVTYLYHPVLPERKDAVKQTFLQDIILSDNLYEPGYMMVFKAAEGLYDSIDEIILKITVAGAQQITDGNFTSNELILSRKVDGTGFPSVVIQRSASGGVTDLPTWTALAWMENVSIGL